MPPHHTIQIGDIMGRVRVYPPHQIAHQGDSLVWHNTTNGAVEVCPNPLLFGNGNPVNIPGRNSSGPQAIVAGPGFYPYVVDCGGGVFAEGGSHPGVIVK